MPKPRVTLVTSNEFPNLEHDDRNLVDALREKGVDPVIVDWEDPTYDWSSAAANVMRCASNYADDREKFLAWTRSVPRLLNHPDVLEWNTDKHYLKELRHRGLPTIDTIWLEPEAHLSKLQVHSRFPALEDFVVKPTISSGGKYAGKFTSADPRSRQEAITHTMEQLQDDRAVMVQRYMEEVAQFGELSLVYMNGLISHAVEKRSKLHDETSFRAGIKETVLEVREPTAEEWRWGEKIRQAVHSMVRDRIGRDDLFLYGRYDLARDGKGGFWLMEASLAEARLYLGDSEERVGRFADAIALRAFW